MHRPQRSAPLCCWLGVRFSDNYDFGVASLGPTGALFGSQGTKKTPSTLFYKPFESWAHNADWTLTLSPGDQVETVAVGNHWCAASTMYYRICT